MVRLRFLFSFTLVFILAATVGLAQTGSTTGSISGVVADDSGIGLPGVTITATNVGTGLTRLTMTEDGGVYRLNLLPPGTYRVSGELTGLGQSRRDNVTVLLGTDTKTDLRITPQLTEEITVTAASPVVDATEPGLTASVTQNQIENLPILGRDFRDLVLLTPGVSSTFGEGVSLNGGRGITADFNIDGAESNSDFFGQQRGGVEGPFTFSQAAIREFQVIRSSYSAEYSRGVGGTMNAITKSGTNELKGEVFYFKRDGDWADERSSTNYEEFFEAKDSAQYGFALGGPIVRDRFHYFLNTDIQDISEPIFSNDIRNNSGFRALTPEIQAAFIARIEGLLGNNLDEEFSYSSKEDQTTYLLKLDANVADNHHLSIRDNFSEFNNFPSESPSPASNQGDELNKFNTVVLQAESVFTSSLFNQLIVQFAEEERPISPLNDSIPSTRINVGTTSFVFGQRDFLPNNTIESKWQIKDSLSYSWNNHQFKGGFEALQADISNLFVRDKSGDFTFSSVENFLAGRPSRFEQGMGPGTGHNVFDYGLYGVFLQDSMTLFKNLTLDLGVRYDWQDLPKPEGNIYPAYPEFVDNFKADDDNIAPRLGFAYDLMGNGRSVVRGGVGMYYNFLPGIILANPLAQISGIFNNIALTCSTTVVCPSYPNLLNATDFARFARTASDVAIVSSDLEAQESIRTSLGFEQQFGSSYSIGLEGVYADISKSQRLVNVNAEPTGLVFGGIVQYNVTNPNRRYPTLQNVRMHVSDAEASYKGVTVSTKKLAVGESRLSWLAHYTWSEAIDQDSNERSTSTAFSLDPYDPELSEGRADYDVTHKVVVSGTYELPFGFFVSGIFNWRTGAPYTRGINVSTFPFSINGLAGVGSTSDPLFPVWVDGNGNVIDLTAANGSSNAQLAEFLNSRDARIIGRNTENLPDFMNIDARLSKRFRIISDLELELIGEVFNVTNEANEFVTFSNRSEFTGRFANNQWTFTRNPNFGKPNALTFASPPRQYQAAVKIRF